jgi:hypothetical protein
VPKNKQALVPVLSTILRFTPAELSESMSMAGRKAATAVPDEKGFMW